MKVFLLIFSILIFIGCAKNDDNQIQLQRTENSSPNITSNKDVNENITQNTSEHLIPVQNSSLGKIPKWTAGNFKGLQLGKSTLRDVRRIFGEPKYILNPEDEYDNPIESKLDYIYENEPQIIIDKKSEIVIEIWGGDFSTFKEAVDKYGNDFYEVEFTKKGCALKEYKEKPNQEFPLYLAYPQYGFYFYLNEKSEVLGISYVDKCG